MSHDSHDLVVPTGVQLRLGTAKGRIQASVEPDEKWRSMWRVRLPEPTAFRHGQLD